MSRKDAKCAKKGLRVNSVLLRLCAKYMSRKDAMCTKKGLRVNSVLLRLCAKYMSRKDAKKGLRVNSGPLRLCAKSYSRKTLFASFAASRGLGPAAYHSQNSSGTKNLAQERHYRRGSCGIPGGLFTFIRAGSGRVFGQIEQFFAFRRTETAERSAQQRQ